jgi:dTDP-4-amino-4,6-dideoxygalactose transaminase
VRAKLPHLDDWNARRRAIAQAYTEGLQHLDLTLPTNLAEDNVVHLYVVRSSQRDKMRAGLVAGGVDARVHYPVPDHLQAPVQRLGNAVLHLPVTEQACAEVLTLPVFPEMTDSEVAYVIDVVYDTLSQGNSV